MTTAEIKAWATEYIMNTYGDRQLALVKGEGAYVWSADGKKYLDFLSGIAVNGLGHCHPKVVSAIQNQAEKLLHVSNLYYIEPQAQLAKLLVENGDLDQCFFCNSGAEANEAAIKIARKFVKDSGRPKANEIITMNQSFHGRTMATISATAQPKYHKGFEPMLPGFVYVPYDDLDAVESAINENTCAILVEPIQSEGGVNVPSSGYLSGLRDLCDRNELVLIFDEVQTSPARLGTFFGYQSWGITPDVITMAKSLGGGTPIGAMMATRSVAESFVPGTHAATFGGNPLVTAAATATLETILEEDICQNATEMGDYMVNKFSTLKGRHPLTDIRGRGLLRGLVFSVDAKPLAAKCADNGLITICTNDHVLRFLPPLNIGKQQIDEAYQLLEQSLADVGL